MALAEIEENSALYNHRRWPRDINGEKFTTRGDGELFDHVSLKWNDWFVRNLNNYKPDGQALRRIAAADKLDAEESGVDKLYFTARRNFHR